MDWAHSQSVQWATGAWSSTRFAAAVSEQDREHPSDDCRLRRVQQECLSRQVRPEVSRAAHRCQVWIMLARSPDLSPCRPPQAGGRSALHRRVASRPNRPGRGPAGVLQDRHGAAKPAPFVRIAPIAGLRMPFDQPIIGQEMRRSGRPWSSDEKRCAAPGDQGDAGGATNPLAGRKHLFN